MKAIPEPPMRYMRFKPTLISAVLLSLLMPGSPRLQGAEGDEALIVECNRPCNAVTAAVAAAGGVVTQQYQNVDAIAVRVPRGSVPALVSVAGADAVRKDVEIAQPRPLELTDVTGQLAMPQALDDAAAAAVSSAQPANYNYNLAFTNVAPLHAAGKRGQFVTVAVIDSGTVNLPDFFPLSGSIIGGETFVCGLHDAPCSVPDSEDKLSATHHENGSHGTMTAEMVAAHAAFVFANTSRFVRALNLYAPGSAIPCSSTMPPPCNATQSVVPMTGTAPAARIYAMKVFPATGGGAPESRVIAAMDRAFTLRLNFNDNDIRSCPNFPSPIASGTGSESDPFVYCKLKIDVVNLSLGGATLFAGRSTLDRLTLKMLDVGITVVTSAGNDGPPAMTGGSPGTGFGSLTVGAASTAVHERVLRDLQFNTTGFGAIYRPTTHTQTAYFSARGPTADGRIDPDIIANGFADYVHAYLAVDATGQLVDCREPGAVPGTCMPRVVFASGTSFSSPTVAGAAAVLRGAHPTRNATQIRNALQRSANPNKLGDNSTRIDQGNGVVDVAAADALLTSGNVSSQVPDLPVDDDDDKEDALGAGGKSVLRNVERAGFDIVNFRSNRYSARIPDLKPGEVAQVFVPSDVLTSNFTVTINQITPELPPGQQNQLFGDDILYQIADAPTSTLVDRGFGFVADAVTVDVPNPQTGLVRVAIMGDWTNAGRVSATVTITRTRKFDGLPTTVGSVAKEVDIIEVDVPAGTANVVFELGWKQNWARYPTNDLDLVVFDPAGNRYTDESLQGLNSPERIEIKGPLVVPGRWKAAITGIEIHGTRHHDRRHDRPPKEIYTFRAEADGRRLKPAN
jgi:subtilisin family serine protease